MPINQHYYMPVLKWRQGEYQALLRLEDAQKDRIVPLIEVTPPDFDFETQTPSKTIDEHVVSFATRIQKKWGSRLALLDCGLLPPATRMADGRHPLVHLFDECTTLSASLVPVTGLDRDDAYQHAVHEIHTWSGHGAVLRCSLEDAIDPDFDANVYLLCETIGIGPNELDIVLDLESPNFDPQDDLIALISAALSGAAIFNSARSLTIVGASFPDSMGSVTGPLQLWPRREWLLYKALLGALGPNIRRPRFGDYAISAPTIAQGDMRLLKPSATIRYTVDDGWLIAKGNNVRDNGFGQYRTCSGHITGSTYYLGAAFSPGSNYVAGCQVGTENTGNLTTWRWVGTNHHITKVVHDLATFYGI